MNKFFAKLGIAVRAARMTYVLQQDQVMTSSESIREVASKLPEELSELRDELRSIATELSALVDTSDPPVERIVKRGPRKKPVVEPSEDPSSVS